MTSQKVTVERTPGVSDVSRVATHVCYTVPASRHDRRLQDKDKVFTGIILEVFSEVEVEVMSPIATNAFSPQPSKAVYTAHIISRKESRLIL